MAEERLFRDGKVLAKDGNVTVAYSGPHPELGHALIHHDGDTHSPAYITPMMREGALRLSLMHTPTRMDAPEEMDPAMLAAARRLAERRGFDPKVAKITHRPPAQSPEDRFKKTRRATLTFTRRLPPQLPEEPPKPQARPRRGLFAFLRRRRPRRK